MKRRDSVIALNLWRFIICTPEKPGVQSKGENRRKLKTKKQKLNNRYFAPLINKFTFGLIFSASLISGPALDIPKAQAANLMETNLNLARSVTSNLSGNIIDGANTNDRVNNAHLALNAEGYLTKPLIAETVVTQDPPRPAQRPRVQPKRTTPPATPAQSKRLAIESGGRSFPFGYCTYYVAQRRSIPWSGNAITWLSGAQKYGFATGNTPQVGAIVVTREGGSAGHVAYIDAVNGDQITISEMNFRGFGVISSRTISTSYGAIMGYIY